MSSHGEVDEVGQRNKQGAVCFVGGSFEVEDVFCIWGGEFEGGVGSWSWKSLILPILNVCSIADAPLLYP